MGLLRIPFTFTQDRLLKSEQFIAWAKDRGIDLSLVDLQELHRLRLLVPVFRVDDEQDGALIIDRQTGDESHWAHWAASGQLHDSARETWTEQWPYELPADAPRGWWDGYYYSPWQVLSLDAAVGARGMIEWGADAQTFVEAADEARSVVLALAALAPRLHARVWGQASLQAGRTFDQFHDAEYEIEESPRLQVAGFSKERLHPAAETLLLRARGRDPLNEFWPLLRYGTHLTWEHLKGPARLALDQRLAAEILLRAHEQLAFDGLLEPLPTPTAGFRHPLHDRITVRDGSADSLNRALARFGLSPQPRVLLVVEGETEQIHIARLLEEYGLEQSNQVRVHVQGTSAVSPRQLAEYVVGPRMGAIRGDRHLIDGPVTGLFVAMDPENDYRPSQLPETERKLRGAVRRAVQLQGADLTEDELDTLVHVFVWGDKSYELANFTDDQLVSAIERLGEEGKHSFGGDRTRWRADCAARLRAARSDDSVIDLERVKGGFGFRLSKPRLAELLLPDLLEALYSDNRDVPVLRMLHEIRELHARLSGTGFSLNTRSASTRDAT